MIHASGICDCCDGPPEEDGPSYCPLCGSRTLQDPFGDPEASWCPDCGLVTAEGLTGARP